MKCHMVGNFPLGNIKHSCIHTPWEKLFLLWQTCFWQEQNSRPEHYREVRRLLDFSVVAEGPSASPVLWHAVNLKSTC